MVAETDDKEERTEESEETGETLSADTALIGWLGAIHAELRASRVEFREGLQAARAEFREGLRETRRELSDRIDRVDERVGGVDERVGRTNERVGGVEARVARIEGGIEAERAGKNRTIMWLGIGVAVLAALATAAGVTVGVIGLLN